MFAYFRLTEKEMASFLGQSTMSGLIPQSPQDAMENAARLVDSNLLKDRNYLDLSDLLKVPTHSMYPSVSHTNRIAYIDFISYLL